MRPIHFIPLATAILSFAISQPLWGQAPDSTGPKQVEVRVIEATLKIDGAIEDLWLSGDSATNFVQHSPYEKSDPTERTVVYLL